MSNFDRAVKALNDVDEAIDHLADNEAYVTALEAAGLLAPDFTNATRLTVVSDGGRMLEEWGITNVNVVIQDDGRTLKIFYRDRKDD